MPGTPDPHETESPSTQSVRESHNSGFQACIDAIPGVGDILSKCSEIGWKAVEEECCQYLLERLAGSPEEAERKFQVASAVDGKEQFHAGNEHYIFLPSDDNQSRVVKWTYGNNFGLKLNVYENDPAGMNQNVIPTGNVDPVYYLKRWIILNTISSPITRLEGLLPPDFLCGERLPRLSISQDMLPPENPTYQEIVRAFRRIGFTNIAENSFYRIEDNVLLGDATPWNVRIVSRKIIPFDAVAENPSGEACDWCRQQAESKS